MALLSPTFLLGVVVVAYLSSFVIFAIIRILTGVSIQRIGYLSLRRLAYTPRDGCRVEIRSLGLNIHRPTFAQPTWVSLVLNELIVTVDLRELDGSKAADAAASTDAAAESPAISPAATPTEKPKLETKADPEVPRAGPWKALYQIKERIKKLHKSVGWLRMVDVVATNSTINIVDAGSLQVGSLTLAVDTRNKTVDRTRFFSLRPGSHKRKPQAEWIITVRSVFFTADGRESLEVLDHAILNVHGFIEPKRDGLRDTTISLKFGRIHLPYDDLMICSKAFKHHRRMSTFREKGLDIPIPTPKPNRVQSDTEEMETQRATDSRKLISSVLRGIKEVQFAVGHIVMSMGVDSVQPNAVPIQLTASMKEIGIDLHRLDQNSAAHRMYFPPKDIAHEGLVAALSLSIGIDDGKGRSDRLLYIPMVTTTVRTTLPSKTVQLSTIGSFEEKNANILYANSVVTSPSIDLDPTHLPVIIALLQPKPKPASMQREHRGSMFSRMLPKANIKFSMHEPVLRIKLKPLEKTDNPDDFDLIISSISSVSMDVESSHSPLGDSHYSLDGSMRLQTHHLYYQTNIGDRFNLITTESFDMKVHVGADPEVSVDLNGTIQSFSVSMVRPEITDGLRQIVHQLRMDVEPDKRVRPKPKSKKRNFLRSAPDWLLRCHIEARDFNAEVAGIDEDISDDTRGVSLHLDVFSAEYRAHRLDGLQKRTPRRRAHSRSLTQSDSDMTPSSSPRFRRKAQIEGDGRRLSLHAKGIEAQIIEAADKIEVEPFLNIPRLELAFSASSDSHGAMFHIQSSVRTIMAQYSLYRHYAIGVAGMTLRKAFMRTGREGPRAPEQGTYARANRLAPPSSSGGDSSATLDSELVIVDFKASLIQLKAEMPHDPLVMLHIFGLEAGRHRWSAPYMAAKLIRLYVQPPRIRHVWAKMIGIKAARVDFREAKQKLSNGTVVDDSLIDVSSEAIRLAVPHEVIVARINDNFINVIKSLEQLHHRFKTGTNEYILDKKPEGPKRVPKISIRTRNFLLEMEDGAFEWKLGMIYRAGRLEQRQRLARDEAFEVKMCRVREEEALRGNSKIRSRSTFARGRQDNSSSSWFRSQSADPFQHGERTPRPGAIPTYDPEGGNCTINGNAKVSESDARMHLDTFNAQAWKKRIDRAYKISQDSVKEMRGIFWGSNHLPDDVEETEHIMEVPPRPALMSATIKDLHILIEKPTFPLKELPDFLHRVGKGMPKDMQYGLLIPMHISINMNETRVSLRDYPLPLLHIPGLKSGQSSRLFAVSLKTNFVLAEEFRGVESTRRVRVNIVPPRSTDPAESNDGSFAIEVRRSIGPVKSFTDVQMDINTALPTRITWGPCYQPAVQDMMMVVESFTKPPIDPSERVGFWDKLRLNFHSRIRVAWKGDGDVHLSLKGTRDPYQVTGNGAGFLFCWRNDVRWNINVAEDPKRLMVVESGEYVWAVPDYGHQVRDAARRRGDTDVQLEDTKSAAIFKKVIMKLSGKVEWIAGLMFEREIVDGKRNFDFIPHYDVVLKNPHFAKAEGDVPYDAFRGFRSRHIHLSIAVRAPADRDWLAENPGPSRSYNTVHLTPRFFTHFFTWWALFSQPMSLPIRQGNLFPGHEKTSKKFGRHLATIKYSLLFAPLFLSHIYKHKDAEDYAEESVSATGVKVRFDGFMLDLHSRREEFNTLGKSKSSTGRTSGIKIHAGHLDLACADFRAVSASLKGTTTEAIRRGSMSALITDQDDKPDVSKFTIPDEDFSWIDMDDFVELDWILPTEAHPDTKIMPLAYAPRLTYFRQTDIGGVISGDPSRTSPFGNEPTHFCTMSHSDDPKHVQHQLIQARLHQLQEQMSNHTRNVGEAELQLVKSATKEPELVADFDALRKHTNVLEDKKTFLESMLEQIENSASRRPSLFKSHMFENGDGAPLDLPEKAHFESEYNNRFVVHNMQLKWNNLLRNIVLRYFHQVSQRRGFVYYLSRPAVKFILDIVDEQNKKKEDATGTNTSPDPAVSETKDAAEDLEARIRSMIGDGRRSTNATFTSNLDAASAAAMEDLEGGIAKEFTPQNSYHVHLIAPQIQLQSDKNKKHVVLITSKGMELKVVEVMDKERISDTVSGLVQRRMLLNMDSAQFFVTHQKWFLTNLVSLYAGSRYGTPVGSAWPPWVPMEIMFDFQNDPFGFKRVVQKTSAMMRYDKFNNLRLKYNDEVNEEDSDANSEDVQVESRSDTLRVEFPQARALCNSSQYYALYVIVLDLLMYSEPLEKTRSERLEKIMLASDFSDLSGAPEMVQKLQERIRQLEEIKMHFHVYSKYLDKRGWEERLLLERDLASCEDELFFMMKAITTSQRKHEQAADTNALLKWSISVRDIVWHLIQDSSEPLVELQLKDMEYDRTDNSDGSHINLIRVGKILGLNLLNDATYPEIIAPYDDPDHPTPVDGKNPDMIRVYWHMLEAIAGITVMDRFEVNLFPMKVQLEREAGKRLFEYIFPGMDGDEKPNKSDTSLSREGDDEDDESINSSTSRLATPALDRDSGFSTKAGSLELRLQPTLSSHRAPEKTPSKTLSANPTDGGHAFRLFRSSTSKTLAKKGSYDSLRPGLPGRSSTGFSTKDSSNADKKSSRFKRRSKSIADSKQQSDDLTKMINRASNYMTFAYIKMPSVVLCVSYKGKDQRNFEDVHDFVFRLPTIEWRNKTWSNLDLALALKKAVVKALISHTGAIIGNKFSKHRPNAEQRSRLRELATSSVLIAPSTASQSYANSINDSDDSSSLHGQSPIDYSRSPPQSRGSTAPFQPRPGSQGSSIISRGSFLMTNSNNSPGSMSIPAILTNPPTPVDTNFSSRDGLGINLRPTSSGDTKSSPVAASMQHRRMLRNLDGRPSTSAGEGGKKTGGGGLRDKISAFTQRIGHRDSGGAPENEEEEEEDEDKSPLRSKRLSWAQARTKTG